VPARSPLLSAQVFAPDAQYIGLPCDYGNGFNCVVVGMVFTFLQTVAGELSQIGTGLNGGRRGDGWCASRHGIVAARA
jgi:hypothetical protein